MQLIQLVHDKALGLPKEKDLLEIPEDVVQNYRGDYLISFRRSPLYHPHQKIENVHACKRFINLFNGDIVFYALETDSLIAPVILWDIAHTLPVGSTITMVGDNIQLHYYQRDYYTGAIEIVKRDKETIVFKKVKPLPVELEAGMDDWTFGIPTGPGDATILNAVVKRILEIRVKNKEIILCGRPGENFKYWDKVKIVGEDIPAPPVQISLKKNTIVKSAKYNNLCIIHDRVFLPSDFDEVMKRYGDFFSFTAFQSIYFDDYANLNPIRYSDYGYLLNQNVLGGIKGLSYGYKDGLPNYTSFKPELLADIESMNGFVTANPLRYSLYNYATGSLYITKRSLWQQCPQNESLTWEQFEDVEHGLRGNQMGILFRINPYAFTQSLFARSSLMYGGRIKYQSSIDKNIFSKSIRGYNYMKKKPLFKESQEDVNMKFRFFAEKYCSNNNKQNPIFPQILDNNSRLKEIIKLILESEFDSTPESIMEYINDFEKYVINSSLSKSSIRYIYFAFINHNHLAKFDLISHPELINQVYLGEKRTIFCKTFKDFFLKNSIKLKIGSFLSSVSLNKFNKNYFFHPDGIKGYYKAIMNSTPFIDYVEEASN